nr:gustatory receptor 68a [Drosophila bipectinata]
MKFLVDIQTAAKPAQFCALVPWYSGHDEETFQTSRIGRWYGRLVALVLLLSTIKLAEGVIFESGQYRLLTSAQGDTEEINRTIETLLCMFSYTMMALSSVQNASRHCRILKDSAGIDEFLDACGYRRKYSCRWLGILVAMASLGVLGVAFYYIHYRSDIKMKRQVHLMLFYSLQLLYSTVFSLYLNTMFMNLAQRIGFLNQRLEDFSLTETEGACDRDSWRELSNMIEVLCKFRYITENLNSVAGVALLFFFGFSFYTVTNQSYLAFATLTSIAGSVSSQSETANTMGLSCAWVVAETITMAIICNACDCLASETNATAQILARVYGKSKHFQNLIDKYLTKSIKQDLEFTAYGFFSIDNSTLFKIFSAVTTYLVILIQFKQLEDSKVEDIATNT